MNPLIIAITLFVLALLIGIAVIGKVPQTLHTPLMSGANSIHGVVLVGVILVAAQLNNLLGYILIFFAALLGTINVVGGYVVTDRMLEMFKPKDRKKAEEAVDMVAATNSGDGSVVVLEAPVMPAKDGATLAKAESTTSIIANVAKQPKPTATAAETKPAAKKRGRPAGSANKPKAAATKKATTDKKPEAKKTTTAAKKPAAKKATTAKKAPAKKPAAKKTTGEK
jgi:NAD(P) transhydrogenase subunit alpha